MEIIEEEDDFFTFEQVLIPRMRKWAEEEDLLSTESLAWCDQIGSKARRIGDIVIGKKDEKVFDAIQKAVDKLNVKISNFAILERNLKVEHGELTMTRLPRRDSIIINHKKLFNSTIY